MQNLALLLFLGFIAWLFARDLKRRQELSPALWIVFTWVVIIGSRAVSTWFDMGRGVTGSDDYDRGNPFERNIYFVLLLSGVITLVRRGVRLEQLFQANKWLFVFFLYWLCSVFWADAPFVALKRWIKDTGNLVMVLVILTERDPMVAARAVFFRCAALLVPLSVLFIRYFSDLGRAYHLPTGEMMFTGVATHKNTLGALVMITGLALVWDLVLWLREKRPGAWWRRLAPELILLAMTLWLLLKCRSATSLACFVIGLAVFFGLGLPAVRARMIRIEAYAIVGGLAFWILNSAFNITAFFVERVLGRDMTLTTRTDVWPILLKHADNPVFGAGFMSFWTGERLETLLNEYFIIQAHNGYLEVYLNGGWLALILLFCVLLASLGSIKRDLMAGDPLARARMMFLTVGVIHNITEASISKGGLIWFILLLALARYPATTRVPAARRITEQPQARPGSVVSGAVPYPTA